jgi:hypothetical protein
MTNWRKVNLCLKVVRTEFMVSSVLISFPLLAKCLRESQGRKCFFGHDSLPVLIFMPVARQTFMVERVLWKKASPLPVSRKQHEKGEGPRSQYTFQVYVDLLPPTAPHLLRFPSPSNDYNS